MTRKGSEAPPFMSGELESLALPELVQMFASGGHSVRISLISPDGRRGTVTIEKGTIGQCRFGDLLGEDAFYVLCRISGRFMVTRTDPERLRRATVQRGWQELLLEAARLEDEESRRGQLAGGEPQSAEVEVSASVFPMFERGPDGHSATADTGLIPKAPAVPTFESPSEWPPPPASAAPPSAAPLSAAPPSAAPPSAPLGAGSTQTAPQPTAPKSVPPQRDEFDTLFAAATKAYVLRQIDEATRLFERCAELRPDDRRVRANMKLLADKKGSR